MILFFTVSSAAPPGQKNLLTQGLPYDRDVVLAAIKTITLRIGNVRCSVHSRSVGFITFTFKGELLTCVVSTCCSMVGPVLELYMDNSGYSYRLFFRSENDAWKWN
jgi:hypothetical protein